MHETLALHISSVVTLLFTPKPQHTRQMEKEVTIPKSSFTAFRLFFCDEQEINEAGKSLFLGVVPPKWLAYHKRLNSPIDVKQALKVKHLMDRASRSRNSAFGFGDAFDFSESSSVSGNASLLRTASEQSESDLSSIGTEEPKSIQRSTASFFTACSHIDTTAPPNPVESIPVKKPRVMFAAVESIKKRGIDIMEPSPVSEGCITDAEPMSDTHNILTKIRESAKATRKRMAAEMGHLKPVNSGKIRYKAGEIIKMEKMLVMVQKPRLQKMYNLALKESGGCDTRVFERWKEYNVVLRSTNDVDKPLLVQFYTTKKVTKFLSQDKVSLHGFDFYFDSNCKVAFYSSLDKTVSITRTGSKESVFYILKTHSSTSAVEWLEFLNGFLPKKSFKDIDIALREVGEPLKLSVTVPWRELEELHPDQSSSVSIREAELGYSYPESRLFGYLADRVIESLTDEGLANQVSLLRKRGQLRFAWRCDDRVEWIFNETQLHLLYAQNCMISTHQLQLGPSSHYPRVACGLKEPVPLEGFLVRLTNHAGYSRSNLHRRVYKLSYFFTSDNYLFFCKPFSAIPPLNSDNAIDFKGKVLNLQALTQELEWLPQVYEHCPFPLNDKGHISWLKSDMSMDEFLKFDRSALYAAERKAFHLMQARGAIPMDQITDISSVSDDDVPAIYQLAGSLIWTGAPQAEVKGCVLRVSLRNGAQLLLQAPSSNIRDIWINSLRNMVEYWSTPKMHNPYDITPWTMSRPIIHSGYIYQKLKKHSNFDKVLGVLCPGYFLLFSGVRRSAQHGTQTPSTHHRRYMAISMENCYVYAGGLSSQELLSKNEEFDQTQLFRENVPRIYENGQRSCESEAERCFTLWFGSKQLVTKNNRLGVTGKNMQFVADSKSQRDLWVNRLLIEIDRFS